MTVLHCEFPAAFTYPAMSVVDVDAATRSFYSNKFGKYFFLAIVLAAAIKIAVNPEVIVKIFDSL